jgi:hypothetical protein
MGSTYRRPCPKAPSRRATGQFVGGAIKLTKTRPGLTISAIGEALRFIEPGLLKRCLEGLRIAGPPE